jgi:hypothetical protein
MDVWMKPGSVHLVTFELSPDTLPNWFHQAWCNSLSYVNETLQKLQIVLVSDPFSKDSEHAAKSKFCLRSRCKFRAIQPDRLSAVI